MASDLDQTHFYNLISSRKLSEYIGVDIVGKCGDFYDQQVPSDDHYRFTTCNHLQLNLNFPGSTWLLRTTIVQTI